MQKDSGILQISVKCSSEAIIVKHGLSLVDFQMMHCLICLNESTATAFSQNLQRGCAIRYAIFQRDPHSVQCYSLAEKLARRGNFDNFSIDICGCS